ncbi:MAG: DUF262 domain-containing HNH endonuclease family protein [Hydrogenothermaceae bacterium]
MKGGIYYNETKFVDAKVKKLVDLILESEFTIPKYQRDYSWGKEEIEEFLDDVEALMNQDFGSDQSLPHFLGSFVFIEKREEERTCYEIIDGQQRITTTMLYFKAIELVAKEYLSGGEYNNIYTIYTRIYTYIYKSMAGQEPRLLRLELGRANDFFRRIISAQNIEEVESIYNNIPRRDIDVINNIYNAFNQIYKHIKDKLRNIPDTTQLFQYILKYIEAVQTMMVAIKIVVQQPSVAYIVFETLNARGKELSSADLIKNMILMKTSNKEEFENVSNIWSQMIEEITQYKEADVTDFLINSYWSNYGYIKKDSLYDEVKDRLEEGGVSKYVETIKTDYLNYLKIAGFDTNPNEKFSEKTIKYLKELNDYLQIERVYPLLLAGASILSKEEFEELTRITINFAFRYKTVLNKSPDGLIKLISRLSIELRNGGKEKLREIMEEFKREASDNDFKTSFPDFKPRTTKLGFYVIKKIEDFLSKGQGITVLNQSPSQHLEHILPKNPKMEEWPHIYRGQGLDERFNIYVDKIGNLTILEADINKRIRNKPFEFKKSEYRNSRLLLPKEISKNENWDFDSIDERGKYLAQLAIQVWNLDLDPNIVVFSQ